MKRALMIGALVLGCSAAQAQDVLVYDNNTDDQVAQTACNNLGYNCTVAGSGNFVTQLTGDDWDLVVMDLPSSPPTGDWQTPLSAYIAGGGRVIQTGWWAADFATLADDFEVILQNEHFAPLAVYDWNASSLFLSPNTVPTPMNPVDDGWNRNGWDLTVAPAGTGAAAAGFVASPTAGKAAIVVGNSGRTIFNGLLFDDYFPLDADTSGKNDIVEMVENQMSETLAARSDTALFHVFKTFSDGSTDDVTVSLSCFAGNPLDQSKTIAGGDLQGVTFVVENIPESGTTCEVTESGGPAGYTTVMNGGAGCSWDDIAVGRFSCNISNNANPATYTVVKDWVIEGTGGDVVDAKAKVTITCDRAISGETEDNGSWSKTENLGDGESLVATVDVSTGPADCSASETVMQSGVESDASGCDEISLSAGESHTCTFTNTVFFEGIPTLNQYGLAILVLLTLGVGFVGFRRFA